MSARIEIIGAGVTGLCCAYRFAERGCEVVVRAASQGPDADCCSWWAGGMLAPWCELESTEPLIASLGVESIEFWKRTVSSVTENGSLVLASARDQPDLRQFADRTRKHSRVNRDHIAELEPDLAGQFDHGLYFNTECHFDPRQALAELLAHLRARPSVSLEFGHRLSESELATPLGKDTNAERQFDWRIDCRGLAARDQLPDLRGVKGEMLLLRQPEISLSRPIRLLHPRYPLYVVPRADHIYMVGATMLERDDRKSASARSVMELLSAAYALHPAFGEAAVLEIGTDARPAFRDNLPRVRRRGRTLYVNGLFRHGFLCSPAVARHTVEFALDHLSDNELIDEDTD